MPAETALSLKDFDYDLPAELIASHPPDDRASAKLLVCGRATGSITHRIFRDISEYFKAGDVLVLNNTKVLPARLLGRKTTGGQVEALLLKSLGVRRWKALLRPGGRIQPGMRLEFSGNGAQLGAIVTDDIERDSGERIIEFESDPRPLLDRIGHIPLPPYIDRPDTPRDREMYQTVYAEKEGAIAAPTAGLHFDQALLEELRKNGVEIVFVTLYVGYGTFQPMMAEDITQHVMFEEQYEISEAAADALNKAKAQGRRIIACGTTTVRALESAAQSGSIESGSRSTRLFIYPPYQFQAVSGLITNFHLPKTSLLCLVSALAGRDQLFRCYDEAIRQNYRFYSYGDAMLVL